MSDPNLNVLGITTFIPNPFAEGYVLNAAEAAVLFQTLRENISNGVRKAVASKQSKAEDGSAFYSPEAAVEAKALIDEYAASYTFSGARKRGPSKSIDPLAAEILSMAKAFVTSKIKEKGLKVADYDKEKFSSLVEKVSADPKMIDAAKKRLEARKKAAAGIDDLDI